MRLPAAVLFLVLPIALVGQGVLTQVLLTLCGVVCLFGFPGGYTPQYGEHVLRSSSRVALLAGPIGLVTASLCPPDQLSVRRPLRTRPTSFPPTRHSGNRLPQKLWTHRLPQVPVALVVLLLPAAAA